MVMLSEQKLGDAGPCSYPAAQVIPAVIVALKGVSRPFFVGIHFPVAAQDASLALAALKGLHIAGGIPQK